LSQALGRGTLTRSATTVLYTDYKYFTVETDVAIR